MTETLKLGKGIKLEQLAFASTFFFFKCIIYVRNLLALGGFLSRSTIQKTKYIKTTTRSRQSHGLRP